MHPTQIHINVTKFSNNLRVIRQQIGSRVKLCLPVKANAYGHGLLGMALRAEPFVDYLGVACLAEGELLRSNGIQVPILVFGAFDEAQIPGLVTNDLEITISSQYKAACLANYCASAGLTCKVHIKVDTGMNRVGVRVSSSYALIDFVLAQPQLELVGVYSHLAASDEVSNPLTHEQIASFNLVHSYVKQRKPGVICHLANSGGVCYFPESYFDMVRPGLLSYGYLPADPAEINEVTVTNFLLNQIKPCFSLLTRVSYFKVVAVDEGISYNHRYYTSTNTRIVTLPIGYGDGYRRGLSAKVSALIRGHKYPLVGNICMDMLMVDIGPTGEAYVGDEVVLIGQQGIETIRICELASALQTITYEILVGFNERIPRVYLAQPEE